MVWQSVLVTTSCGVDFAGKVKVSPTPLPGAKAKSRCRGGGSPGDFTEATSQVVVVPILVNKVRLRVGQQLLVFKKAAVKRARVTIAQLAKKPRGVLQGLVMEWLRARAAERLRAPVHAVSGA